MRPERAAWLTLLPILAELGYYTLPATLQHNL